MPHYCLAYPERRFFFFWNRDLFLCWMFSFFHIWTPRGSLYSHPCYLFIYFPLQSVGGGTLYKKTISHFLSLQAFLLQIPRWKWIKTAWLFHLDLETYFTELWSLSSVFPGKLWFYVTVKMLSISANFSKCCQNFYVGDGDRWPERDTTSQERKCLPWLPTGLQDPRAYFSKMICELLCGWWKEEDSSVLAISSWNITASFPRLSPSIVVKVITTQQQNPSSNKSVWRVLKQTTPKLLVSVGTVIFSGDHI